MLFRSGSATSYTVTGLASGTRYWYRVYAVSATGNGTPVAVTFIAIAGATTGNFASAPSNTNTSAGTLPDSGSNTSAAYASAVAADNPVGYWVLNDAVGSTAAGTGSAAVAGTATSVTFAGGSNLSPMGLTAASFNGSASKIMIPASAAWQTSDFTAEAWIKPSSSGGWNTVFARGNSQNPWGLWVHGAGFLYTRIWAGGANYALQSSTPVIQANTWQHVALTYDGSTIALWVNGAMVASRPLTVVLDSYDSSLTIGVEDSTSSYFNGLISNVALYPQALSASRLQTHVQAAGLAVNTYVVPSVVVGDSQATVSWTAPSYSAETITGYEVQWVANTQSAPVYPATGSFVSAATTSFTATGLANGTEYTFRVRAIMASGAGQWSNQVTAWVYGTTAAPNALAATMSSGSIALSWTAPTTTTTGRPIGAITGYRIEQSTDGSTWSTLSGNAGTGTSFTVNGRPFGTIVYYRVSTVTISGIEIGRAHV